MPLGAARFGLLGGVADLGKLELIETQNPSAATTIDFTSIAESTYNVHFMTWQLDPSGDDTGLVRLSTDGGSSFVSSGYQHAEQFGDAGGTFSEFKSTSASFLARLGDSGGAGANELHNGYMYFYNLGDSAKYSFATYQTTGLDTSAVYTMMFGSAVYPTANTVNAIRLFGNIGFNFTGTVSLYGIAES
jgi:hypothetical protein